MQRAGGTETSECGMARRQVLLVGSEGMAPMLRDYLRHLGDYEVASVECCDEAMTTLSRRSFDLVLLLSLRVRWTRKVAPVGYEEAMGFLHQMRVHHSSLSVIVASAAEQASERCLSMGAFAFIPQPIKLDELGSLVTRALEANRMDGRLADENSVG